MVKVIESREEIPTNGCVVIDFYATWCGPCKVIAPKFEELAKLYPNITFLKVDVDESGELVDQYNIHAMPTFVFLRDGVQIHKIEGADLRGIGQALEVMSK